MAYKGRFIPKNPKKYKGDPTNIIFRSLWERNVMTYLDENINVLQWSSEEVIVPYISPKDNRQHRYFPDFVATMRRPDGTVKTVMIEVKPYAQTQEPKKQSRKTKQYINEVVTYGVNKAKWQYAKEYCDRRGWDFTLITERELGLVNNKPKK